MGAILPKPVESAVIERQESKAFRVGLAEVNGWRNSMEDAHLIYISSDWGFFGVFDGHGGDQCSSFVAERLHKELAAQGCPPNDAAVKKLILDADSAFLATDQGSGSTGTMCIVHKLPHSGKCRLRIANVGDSRVLLGRRDGTIVDGGGTDKGLTIDHKPENPDERQRIYRCGGHVEEGENGGPARVNGELSVSRCFGDRTHKVTGGPGPEDHPVTADPELGHFDCDESDFLLLVCDGVSEGEFPNADVVRVVAACLEHNCDPGAAARTVCHKAIEANSKDNITCMVVMLSGSQTEETRKHIEFVPGPLCAPTNKAFMTAYEGMAKRAGVTLARAAEMRYEALMELLANNRLVASKAGELREEAEGIGKPAGVKGSSERSAWFRAWEERLPSQMTTDDMDPDAMLTRLLVGRGLGGLSGSMPGGGRRVRVPDQMTLRVAISENPALDWDERMARLVDTEGEVEQDDPSDDTSKVFFPGLGTAWLPTSILLACEDGSPARSPNEMRSRPPASAPAVGIDAAADSRAQYGQLPPRPQSDQTMRRSSNALSGRRNIPPAGRGSMPGAADSTRTTVAPRFPGAPAAGRGRTPSPCDSVGASRNTGAGRGAASPGVSGATARLIAGGGGRTNSPDSVGRGASRLAMGGGGGSLGSVGSATLPSRLTSGRGAGYRIASPGITAVANQVVAGGGRSPPAGNAMSAGLSATGGRRTPPSESVPAGGRLRNGAGRYQPSAMRSSRSMPPAI
mmetsp:Transcript_14128/g.38749  ORF Transcript_14128/g.38749 Transcript_14128/m.38749 type:complete len:742 (-) Transcript_14128:161-2386(-)